jgi:DNA-binding transcriptional LysR family regulator
VLDFNDLQFFAAVIKHRGFSAAARALGVPKSRLSRRVTVLEEHLGVRLLERSTRHLALTEIGQQVYEHAQAAVAEAAAVEEAAQRMRAEPRGRVRVSCPAGLQGAIAEGLPAFLATYPMLRVLCMITDRRIDLIHEGIDVAVRVRERLDTDADLQMRRIGISRRVLVASPSFVATHPSIDGPEDLCNVPLLSQHEHPVSSTWNLATGDGRSETISFEPRLATGSFELLLSSARAGLGVGLLPAYNCGEDIQSGRLVRILPDWSGSDGILHVIFTSRRGMVPGVRAVVDFLADALKCAAD